MPTISLRRAQQIANRIAKETAFEIEVDDDEYGYRRRKRKTPVLSAVATVNIDGNPAQRVAALRENLNAKRARIFRLLAIGTTIRQRAGEEQARCGITALVTSRVALVKKQQILEALLGASDTQGFNREEFDAQVAAMRERLAKGTNNQATAEITTSLLTGEDRAEMEAELRGVRRRFLDVEDRLSELNAAHTITISDEEEEYLRQQGIA